MNKPIRNEPPLNNLPVYGFYGFLFGPDYSTYKHEEYLHHTPCYDKT